MKPLEPPPPSDTESLILSLSKMVMDRRPQKSKSAKTQLLLLKTVKKHCASAVDYWTYRTSIHSSRYGKTGPSYLAKSAKKVVSQMKVHFFSPKAQIALTRILSTFKLICDTNHNHEEAAMQMLWHFVHATLAKALSSRMYAENSSEQFTA